MKTYFQVIVWIIAMSCVFVFAYPYLVGANSTERSLMGIVLVIVYVPVFAIALHRILFPKRRKESQNGNGRYSMRKISVIKDIRKRISWAFRRLWSSLSQPGTGGLVQAGDWRCNYPEGNNSRWISYGDAKNCKNLWGGTLEWRGDSALHTPPTGDSLCQE